jgi:hypothetical protein
MAPRTSKIKDVKPTKAWAAISDDVPPEIWGVHWYKSELQSNLRKIRVMITPIKPKRRADG